MSERPEAPIPPTSLRAPVIEPGHTLASVTDSIAQIVLTKKPNKYLLVGFTIAFALFMLLLWALGNLVTRGIGLWGVNQPVGWGFDIPRAYLTGWTVVAASLLMTALIWACVFDKGGAA